MQDWNDSSLTAMNRMSDVGPLGPIPVLHRRRRFSEEAQRTALSMHDKEETSIAMEICSALEIKEDQIEQEMQELKLAQKTCRNALEMIRREEASWREKLDIIKRKMIVAENKKRETDMMLKLHTTLAGSKTLSGTVRNVQKILSDDVPKDVQVMVVDCLNNRHTVSAKECVVCTSDFTAEDLLSVDTSERCRHTVYPCGHSALCGKCAKRIYQTTRICPLCRAFMTKRPKIFRPGRQQ